MCLGDRVRWLRKQAHLTLAEVGQRTGLTVSFLSDIERGRTVPSLASMERIARAYGLTIGESLVDVEIEPDQPSTVALHKRRQ